MHILFDIMQQILILLESRVYLFPQQQSGLQYLEWLSNVPIDARRVAVGEVVDIHKIFSNLVRYNTPAVTKIQIMNFLYVTFWTPRFLKWLQCF
jgi:hypothetical protein